MIVLLALGIGGVVTLFSPLYSLVLTPLAFPQPERLVRIGGNLPLFESYYDTFLRRRALDPIFSAVAAYAVAQMSTSIDGRPEELDAAAVTPEFFASIGIPPRRGQDFRESATDARVAVVSDAFWRSYLNADPTAVGRSIELQGNPFTVTGVMPPNFNFPPGTQVWVPTRAVSSHGDIQCIARLNPGISLKRAAIALKTIYGGPKPIAGYGYSSFDGPVLQTLQSFLLGDRRPLLWILSTVSLLFLCLSCAGVANLLLARGVGRRQEMVVRLVLGAGRWRLLRQLLTESFLLAIAGGVLGLVLSVFGAGALRLLLPAAFSDASVSPFVVPFMIALALAAAVLCGLAPALHATSIDLNSALKARNCSITGGAPRHGIFNIHELLTGAQLLLAMILLVSSSLLARSLAAHLRIPLGFEPKDVAVVKTDFSELPATITATQNYGTQHGLKAGSGPGKGDALSMRLTVKSVQDAEDARDQLFYRSAVDRLAHVPGAMAAAIFTPRPYQEGANEYGGLFHKLDGYGGPAVGCLRRQVSPGAFGVLGIHFLAGRDFLPGDAVEFANHWKVALADPIPAPRIISGVVINEALAKRFWPNQDPIGQQLGWIGSLRFRVIGVVSDIHETAGRLDSEPTVYSPFEFWPGKVTFVVKLRPGTSLTTFSASARRTLAMIEPDLPPPPVASLQDSVTASFGELRLALALLSCFSVLGLVVASLSVYATATLMSAARIREMGIRVALGASGEQIRNLSLLRSLRVSILALGVGAFGSWALARSLSHWLFQVGTGDPLSYLGSGALLLGITVGAGLLPSVRASAIDPAVALRDSG